MKSSICTCGHAAYDHIDELYICSKCDCTRFMEPVGKIRKQKESSRPGKFYILVKDDDKASDETSYWQVVWATVLPYKGMHLIVHQANDDPTLWCVSEMITGMNVVRGHKYKDAAKSAAKYKINILGLGFVLQQIYHNVEQFGAAPRFHKPKHQRPKDE